MHGRAAHKLRAGKGCAFGLLARDCDFEFREFRHGLGRLVGARLPGLLLQGLDVNLQRVGRTNERS